MAFENLQDISDEEAELSPEQTEIQQLKERLKAAEERIEELEELAYVDRLTGVLNRHGLDEVTGTLIAQRERKEPTEVAKPMAVMIVDIDNFKKLNDTKGHDKGDEVLRNAGQFFKNSVRRGDVVARWGGEEFVVVFDRVNAQDVFNKYFDKESSNSRIQFNDATFSGGITTLQAGEDIETAIARADKALYASKKTGKDHLLITENPEEDLPQFGDEAKK